MSSSQGRRWPVNSEVCVNLWQGAPASHLYKALAKLGQAAQLCVFTLGTPYLSLDALSLCLGMGLQCSFSSENTQPYQHLAAKFSCIMGKSFTKSPTTKEKSVSSWGQLIREATTFSSHSIAKCDALFGYPTVSLCEKHCR